MALVLVPRIRRTTHDLRQKQNSKKNRKKSKSTSKEQAGDSFPESNSTAKMGFSYAVMGVGVRYKLISGISISPNHSIGETTMFPEASRSDTRVAIPIWMAFSEMVFTGVDGSQIWFRQITQRHTFYPASIRDFQEQRSSGMV